MPKEGLFAKVVKGGIIKPLESIKLLYSLKIDTNNITLKVS